MEEEIPDRMISEAFEDPVRFSKLGRAYTLLQYYFKGYDIETLRPFLRSTDLYLQSIGTFIASELGKNAYELIDDLIPLLNSENLRMKYDVLETVLLCSVHDNADKFEYVVKAMNDKDEAIRTRAMELTVVAYQEQIEGALAKLQNSSSDGDRLHCQGLTHLMSRENVSAETIVELVYSNAAILRKYGAILAKINQSRYPHLLQGMVNSDDPDIRVFALDNLESQD